MFKIDVVFSFFDDAFINFSVKLIVPGIEIRNIRISIPEDTSAPYCRDMIAGNRDRFSSERFAI